MGAAPGDRKIVELSEELELAVGVLCTTAHCPVLIDWSGLNVG